MEINPTNIFRLRTFAPRVRDELEYLSGYSKNRPEILPLKIAPQAPVRARQSFTLDRRARQFLYRKSTRVAGQVRALRR